MEFWLGGYVKDRFFVTHPETLGALKGNIREKIASIPPKMSENVVKNALKRAHQTSMKSTMDKEKLESLKSQKENHEQLKKLWKANQDYLDRNFEICHLLKQNFALENVEKRTAWHKV